MVRRALPRPSPRNAALAALALALAIALAAAGMKLTLTTAKAQDTLTIAGRVVNGTAGAEIPGNLPVLLLATGPDGTIETTGQTEAGPDGGFVLGQVALFEGASYNVSVDYGGVFYGETLSPGQLADEVVITVFEPTENASLMRVDRQVMVISEFDTSERMATATEFVRFTNPVDRTLKANLETAAPGMFSFMRFALPPDAAEITVQSDLRGGEVISVGSGFALTAAVPPGEHSVDFAYVFPYGSGALEYRNSLPQGATIFQILAPNSYQSLEIEGLTPRPPVAIGQEIYRAWEARDVPAGQGVQIRIDGMPQPGILARVGSILSGDAFWVAAIPAGVGAALLAFLVLGLSQGSRSTPALKSAAHPDADHQPDTEALERTEIVSWLAALDERYHNGGIGHDEYVLRRAELVARALGEPLPAGE